MLSICIPTYNYNVIDLVYDLHKQCILNKIEFEIIVLEDGSEKKNYDNNKVKLFNLTNTSHTLLEKNIGRSATRNMLASQSKYENILFLDCDSKVPNQNFIKKYLENINNDVVCGGTIYLKTQKEKNKTLRYKYGITTEMKNSDYRNINPNKSFTTNNFLISRKIFDSIKFREFLKKYGHEDSLFGYELKINSYKIYHINNPVIHEGIEDNELFLKKTQEGIQNLISLSKNDNIDKNFALEIKLIKTFNIIKKLNLSYSLKLFSKLFNKCIVNHLLKSNNPSIFLFNLYKLGFYSCEYYKAKK